MVKETRRPGRKPDPIKQAWALLYGLSNLQSRRLLTRDMLSALDGCADDSARRILLGVGRGANSAYKKVKRFTLPKKKPAKQYHVVIPPNCDRMMFLSEFVASHRKPPQPERVISEVRDEAANR